MRDSPDPEQPLSFDFPDEPSAEPVAAEAFDLSIHITDPEVIAELEAQPNARAQAEFARDALRLGVLAMRGARRQEDGAALSRESDRLHEELTRNLVARQSESTFQLTELLREYFDPASGKFNDRVERLVQREGELEQLLKRQVAGDDSALARTLAAHLGEHSPVMRVLDPEQSDGLVASLTELIQQNLDAQRERILREFSLENADGALARLVREVSEFRDTLGQSLDERIGEVVGEFSLDDEESPLSRLVQRVEFTQQQIYDEFSLEEGASSLGRVRNELLSVLETQKREASDFQREVRQTLASMAASTDAVVPVARQAHDFQSALFAFFRRQSHRLGDVVERTADTSGRIRGSKRGKIVVELGADCAAASARIVVEADSEASFTLAGALDELEGARGNRDAGVGLFVFPRQNYPEGLPPLERHGNDVVVVWDLEDPTSDVFLEGGLMVARALCVRERATRDNELENLDAIVLSILEIQRQASGLDEIERLTASVRVNADKVLKRAVAMRDGLSSEFDALARRVEELRHRIGD
jgi:hypothetical protein